MDSTVTRLDQLLYAWLAEPDDRRFDQAFKKYYDEASIYLVRYLARRSSLPDLDYEQIAVDALLKFFGRVGRDRRQAADLVSNTLPQIQPLNFGPFHIRQVSRWTNDVGSFKDAAMRFTVGQQEDRIRPWKSEIQVMNENIPPLQRQGCHLLEPVRVAVVGIPQIAASEHDDLANSVEEPASADYVILSAFVAGLRSAAKEGAAAVTLAEAKHPGVTRFVDGTWTVIDVLPLLRVPTNGYLFDIAQSLYLDDCKARGRQKRGGVATHYAGVVESGEHGGLHPLAQISLDEGGSQDEDPSMGEASGFTAIGWNKGAADLGFDAATEQIGEDFCQRFFDYLRKPLKDAEEAYRQAAATGPAKAERKRLESLSQKNARVMTILTMRIEGQTQEAIAEALSISRNQVKYVVELMQSAYEQFSAAAMRPSR